MKKSHAQRWTQAQYHKYLATRGPAQVRIKCLLLNPELETEDLVEMNAHQICEELNVFWGENWPDTIQIGRATVGPKNPENVTTKSDREKISFTDIEIISRKVISDDYQVVFTGVVNNLANLVNNIDAWELEDDRSTELEVLVGRK